MKSVYKIVSYLGIYFLFVAQAFSHESETVHEEVPASVDPVLAIGVIVFFAIGGIIVWRLMKGKKTTPITTPHAQTEVPKTAEPSSQPENIEAKK